MTQDDFGDNYQTDASESDGFQYNQPGSKKERSIPSHELRIAAVALGLKAHLASTFADVAYWLQSAKYKRGGKPAIWLTGRQASARVGGHPRTLNRNLRELAKRGLIQINYAPAPAGPFLRVTWVSATELTTNLYAMAASISKEREAQRKQRQASPFDVSSEWN